MNRPVEWFPGEWNFCCDRCGFEYKSSQARHEWTGLIVCPYCWDPRHPQDFVRGRADRIAVPWVRICCDDTFLPDILKVQLWSTARGGDNSAGVGSLSSVSSPSLALVPSAAFQEYNARCSGAVDVVALAFNDTDGLGSLFVLDSVTPANDRDIYGDIEALSAEFTYAGQEKYIFSPDNSGFMRWSAHNLFLNSNTPADQNVTVVSGQLYAVIITGATTTTISGAGSGSLSAGTTTFTATTTTLSFGSTTGSGTITVCKWPADTTVYLATGGSPRYAFPIERDASGTVLGWRSETGGTNNLTSSNNFTVGSGWTANGITMNQDATDAGGIANRAWTMTASLGTANKRLETFFGTGVMCASVFAKAGNKANWIALFDKAVTTDGAYFNLATGAVGAIKGGGQARIRDIGNGWYECSYSTNSTGSRFMQISIHTADDQNYNWNADGDETILISDAQLEGSAVPGYPSTRIPTFTAGGQSRVDDDVTRATSTWNHSATVNTAAVQFIPLANHDLPNCQALALHDGTANEQIAMGTTNTGLGRITIIDGGVAQTAPLEGASSVTLLAASRLAAKWKANDILLSLDGETAVQDAAATLPTVTTLQVGQTGTQVIMNGAWVQRVLICPGDDSNAAAIAALSTAI